MADMKDKKEETIHQEEEAVKAEDLEALLPEKTAKKQKQTALSIEYLLDRATLPHFHATYRKNK